MLLSAENGSDELDGGNDQPLTSRLHSNGNTRVIYKEGQNHWQTDRLVA